MPGFLKKFGNYYDLFGWRGLWLSVKTRLLRQPTEVTTYVPRLEHSLHLRLKTTDVATLRKIFADREYEIALARRPAVIVDAGANVGLASIFFARQFPDA